MASLWKKIEIDAIHMPMNQEKKYLIVTQNDLANWSEARALASLKAKHVAKFLYENVVCQYRCFQTMMYDGGSENKKQIIELAICYAIR